jgi:hypothetical protein
MRGEKRARGTTKFDIYKVLYLASEFNSLLRMQTFFFLFPILNTRYLTCDEKDKRHLRSPRDSKRNTLPYLVTTKLNLRYNGPIG